MTGFSDPIIGGGGALVYPSIHDPNFVTTISGWTVNRNGTAEFNSVTIRNGQVISGTSLFYSGTPALGNLIASIAVAPGTDTPGNAYLGQIAAYGANLGFTKLFARLAGGVVNVGSQNAATQITTPGWLYDRDALAAATAPATGVSSPVTSAGQVAVLTLFGESADASAISQAVISAGASLIPAALTSALLEVQGTLNASGLATLQAGLNVTGTSALGAVTCAALTASGTVQLNGKLSTQATSLGSAPADPAGTASLTQVMMGLGSTWALTPGSGGKVQVTVTGLVTTATAIATPQWSGRFGTGTAPAAAAPVTGSRFGPLGNLTTKPQGIGIFVPFSITALLSLVAGTAYWFDLALATSNAADSASFSQLSVSLVEIR